MVEPNKEGIETRIELLRWGLPAKCKLCAWELIIVMTGLSSSGNVCCNKRRPVEKVCKCDQKHKNRFSYRTNIESFWFCSSSWSELLSKSAFSHHVVSRHRDKQNPSFWTQSKRNPEQSKPQPRKIERLNFFCWFFCFTSTPCWCA